MDKHSGLCWNRRMCPKAPGGDNNQAGKSSCAPPAFAGFLWEALLAFELRVVVFVLSTTPDSASNLNIGHARCLWLQSSITLSKQQGIHGEQQQEFRATEQRALRSSGMAQAAPVGFHQFWVWALLSPPSRNNPGVPQVHVRNTGEDQHCPGQGKASRQLPEQRFQPVNPCQEGQHPNRVASVLKPSLSAKLLFCNFFAGLTNKHTRRQGDSTASSECIVTSPLTQLGKNPETEPGKKKTERNTTNTY